MIKTTLKWHEVMLGGMTGVMRHVKSLKKGLKDAHGYDGEDGWTKHIDGALGEVARRQSPRSLLGWPHRHVQVGRPWRHYSSQDAEPGGL